MIENYGRIDVDSSAVSFASPVSKTSSKRAAWNKTPNAITL